MRPCLRFIEAKQDLLEPPLEGCKSALPRARTPPDRLQPAWPMGKEETHVEGGGQGGKEEMSEVRRE